MDVLKAKEFLEILAEGINPMTGEVLPPQDSCNQVEVVRALHTAIRILEKSIPGSERVNQEKAGTPWSSNEENQLITEYKTGMRAYEMAKLHGRTERAIAARLVRLGIVKQRSDVQ